MKRFLTLFLTLLCVAVASADKVVDASSKRRPDWLGGVENEYIIVSAEGLDLESAREKAMTCVREQIVAAVATTVHSATAILIHEITDNGSIQSHREMVSEQSVRAADIPYLADVSPSHAEDFYWVKVLKQEGKKARRSTGETYYSYHIKYPLSDSTLHVLVADYEAAQQRINDQLQAFASVNMADFDDLSQMLLKHAELKQFDASLREDDPRHPICQAIRRSYEQMMLTNIHVEAIECTRLQTVVHLLYGSKPIAASLQPKAQSNCLTAIQIRQTPEADVFTYDYSSGCYDDEPNSLDVAYTLFGKKISGRFFIK